jgi:hypothetical protein
LELLGAVALVGVFLKRLRDAGLIGAGERFVFAVCEIFLEDLPQMRKVRFFLKFVCQQFADQRFVRVVGMEQGI